MYITLAKQQNRNRREFFFPKNIQQRALSHTNLPFQDRSWISNTSVASGGICGGYPLVPYAYSELQVSSQVSPLLMVATAMSQPLITLPVIINVREQCKYDSALFTPLTIRLTKPLINLQKIMTHSTHQV